MLSKILIAAVLATAAAQCVPPTIDSTVEEREAFKTKAALCIAGFDQLEACVDSAPTRLDDCCASCKPPVLPEPVCDLAAKRACVITLANATECTNEATFLDGFDINTCCSTCKPRPPPDAIKPDADERCSKAKWDACTLAQPACTAETLDLREAGAGSLVAERTCCGICTPPQDRPDCNFRKVLANTVDLVRCAPDQRPAIVAGSCALSCRPPAPVCDPGCTDDQVCIRTKTGPTCAKKGIRRFRIRAVAAVRDFVLGLSDEELEVSVVEVVRRHCARATTNTDNKRVIRRCRAFQAVLEDIKVIRRNRDETDAETIEVDIAFDGREEKISDSARRLLAEEDANAGDLLNDALTDSDAAEDLTITEKDDATSAASSAAASLFAVALCVLHA